MGSKNKIAKHVKARHISCLENAGYFFEKVISKGKEI